MIKFTSIIDESIIQTLDSFLLENTMQECTIEHLIENGQYVLCGYFEDENHGQKIFSAIKKEFSSVKDWLREELHETDWANEYKKYCKPLVFNEFSWVPIWMKNDFQPTKKTEIIYIDSSSAFGTGMHETTRLCAKALETFLMMYKKNSDLCVKKCMDVGCGTGILGISALKVGLQSAVFIDNDEQAINVCQNNVISNDINPGRVEYIHSDLRIGLLGRQGDLVFVNILANVLMDNADLIASSVRSGGLLCLSGILLEEMDDVRQVFKQSFNKLWDSSLENYAKSGQWGVLMFGRG